jgi:hypothetical protein
MGHLETGGSREPEHVLRPAGIRDDGARRKVGYYLNLVRAWFIILIVSGSGAALLTALLTRG